MGDSLQHRAHLSVLNAIIIGQESAKEVTPWGLGRYITFQDMWGLLVNCLTDLCGRMPNNDSTNISHWRKLAIHQNAHQSVWWVSRRDTWLIWSVINSGWLLVWDLDQFGYTS